MPDPGSPPGARRRSVPTATGVGLAILAVIAGSCLAAGWLSADPIAQPDPAGGRHQSPGTVLYRVERAESRTLLVTAARIDGTLLRAEHGGTPVEIPLADLRAREADGLPPRTRLLLGSDRFGRDSLARLLHGGRVSLAVALLATACAAAMGIGVGALAALGPGWLDALLMRLVDALIAFPRLFLLILLAALWSPGLAVTVVVIGATSWMDLARIVRGELRSLVERDYILAARASGLASPRLLARHLLPALGPILAVDANLRFADAILFEAALGFLGLGVQAPTPSWGNLLADGRETWFEAWWMAVFPGLAVTLTVIACGLLADGLRSRRQAAVG